MARGGSADAGADAAPQATPLVQADHVILAIPPEQALALLATSSESNAQQLHSDLKAMENAYLAPQWVMGLVLQDAPALRQSANNDHVWHPVSDVIDQVTLESAKPKRSEHTVLQIQATSAWSEARLDWTKEEVAAELIYVAKNLLPEYVGAAGNYRAMHVHRWLYSCPHPQRAPQQAYQSSNTGLHVCGDYFLAKGKQDGVESAFSSGQQLADHLVKQAVEQMA